MTDPSPLEASDESQSVAAPPPPVSLKSERIQLALRELPGWELTADGDAIERLYNCTSLEAALTFLCFTLTTSFDRKRTARATIEETSVRLRLFTPAAGGVTQPDIDFAYLLDRR